MTRLVIDCETGATRTEPASARTASPPPPPTAAERLAAMPAAEAEAIAALALGIAGDAGDLWDALDAMTPTSDARPAVEIVTHHAIEAGLALLDQENPE